VSEAAEDDGKRVRFDVEADQALTDIE